MSSESAVPESARGGPQRTDASEWRYPGWGGFLFYYFIRTSILIVATLYFRVSRRGLGNFPGSGPVMIVSNHASDLDPTLISLITMRRVAFLAKAELFEIPVLGAAIKLLGAFPIHRGEGDRVAIRVCIRMLKEGRPLLIFPEGTRTRDGRLQDAKAGVAMILQQVPEAEIVPVRIDGSYEAFGQGVGFPRPVRVRLTIGKAFRVSEMEDLPVIKKLLYHEIGRRIMDKISTASP